MTACEGGPWLLLAAWVLHDLEEAAAVGLMAPLVGLACLRGARTNGRSRFYRAIIAGLGAHAGTHLGASALLRRYTAGVATALPVLLPGALAASRDLNRDGTPLRARDRALGAAILLPAALACHVFVRVTMRRRTG